MHGYPEKKQIFERLYPLLGNDELNFETPYEMMSIQLNNIARARQFVSDDSMARLTEWLVFIRETHSEPETWNGLLDNTIRTILSRFNPSERAEHWPWLKKLLQTMLRAGFDANNSNRDGQTTIRFAVICWYIPYVRERTECPKDCCEDYEPTKDSNVQIFAELVGLLLEYGWRYEPCQREWHAHRRSLRQRRR